jgi:L-alanine-DL-glutamate epimerase-like enolase superfamily enzyme
MKITEARLIVCSPDRNFVTLKISTDEGIHSLGGATLNGRYLSEHVRHPDGLAGQRNKDSMSMSFGIFQRDIVMAAKKTTCVARIAASGNMPGSDKT